jgi:hypothetical protein
MDKNTPKRKNQAKENQPQKPLVMSGRRSGRIAQP